MGLKRVLMLVALVVAVIVVALGTVVAFAFIGRQSIIDGTEVNGARIVKDGIVSVAMLPVGPGQVALIDGGNDSQGKAILAELSRRQLGPDNVTAIFITHGHGDHIGGVHLFPRATVFALDREVALIEGREGAHGPATRLMPVSPTGIHVGHPLHDGDTVTVGTTTIQAFAVPGHTAGSAAYLANGVLFMGDAADIGTHGEIVGSPWLFSDDQAEDRRSIVNLAHRLDASHTAVAAVACAHSGMSANGLMPMEIFAKTAF